MTKKIFGAICFVLGACVGGAGTYFVVKKRLEKDFDAQVQGISDFYINKYVKKEVPVVKNEENKAENAVSESNLFEKNDINLAQKNASTLNNNDFKTEDFKKSYASMFVGDGKINENLADPRPDLDKKDFNFPVRISRGEFENSKSQVYLTYYEEAGVLATLDDMESDYDEDYFGIDNLSKFGDNNEEYDEDMFTLHFKDVENGRCFEIYYEPHLSWEEVKANTGGCK